MCLLLSSQLILSSASDVFDSNDSFNDLSPVSPILLTAYMMRKEMCELLMDGFFLLPSQLRKSTVSVVFDFSVSLNDVAPVFPMLLSVNKERIRKKHSSTKPFFPFLFTYSHLR